MFIPHLCFFFGFLLFATQFLTKVVGKGAGGAHSQDDFSSPSGPIIVTLVITEDLFNEPALLQSGVRQCLPKKSCNFKLTVNAMIQKF